MILLTQSYAKHDSMSIEENIYMIDKMYQFFNVMDNTIAQDFVNNKIPTCSNNAYNYLASYMELNCGYEDCSAALPYDFFVDECCFNDMPWPSLEMGCENWQGENFQECCMECTNSDSPVFPFLCADDADHIFGSIACDTNPLSEATEPLPAGVECGDYDVVFDGKYNANDGTEMTVSDCGFLMDIIFEEDATPELIADMMSTNDKIGGMLQDPSLAFRPIVANGDVTMTKDSKCVLLLAPHINGDVAINPTNTSYTEDLGPEILVFNSTIYADSPPINMYQAKYVFVEGRNYGASMNIDTADTVKIGRYINMGSLTVKNSMDLTILNFINANSVVLRNVVASVHNITNHNSGTFVIEGQEVIATQIKNEAFITVKSGTRCILDIYKNSGNIVIENGATCDVYLNKNDLSDLGTLTYPASGVTIYEGTYVPPMQEPLVEAFGKWTTGAVRAGKKRWVGDDAIDHGDCDMFRHHTLGIKSLIQSPSNETFNAILEFSHFKRNLHVDLSYINITLHDKDSNEWHFHRYLFENSDVITHLELPSVNANGVVPSSVDNFRVILSVDFSDLGIPKSMQNTVEIDVYSYRHRKGGLKLDALDCVKLHDVGVVHT